MKKLFVLLLILVCLGCEQNMTTTPTITTVSSRFRLLEEECGKFPNDEDYYVYLDTKTGNKYLYLFESYGFGDQKVGGPSFSLLSDEPNQENIKKYNLEGVK